MHPPSVNRFRKVSGMLGFHDFVKNESVRRTMSRLRFPLEDLDEAGSWEALTHLFGGWLSEAMRQDIQRRAGVWSSAERVLTAYILAALYQDGLARSICPDPYTALSDLDIAGRLAVCACVVRDAPV